jgi:polyisoprenoid-binding protein YceI
MTMRRLLPLLALPLLFAEQASAHHAFAADYEAGNEGVLEGVITEVIFKNPHARYYLEVANDDGTTELWDLQTMNLMALGRFGWTKDTLKVGDEIRVEGILGRNDTKRMSINVVTTADGRVISPVRSLGKSNAELAAAAGETNAAEPSEFDSVAANITPGKYILEENHAYLSFSYSHLGLSNPQLQFTEFDAELELNGNNMAESVVSITIDASSIDTAVPALDEELRGDGFFDVANNPYITFETTFYEETSENTGRLTGDLTVMGIAKPVTLDVTINSASMNAMNRREMIGVSATGTVNRSDFGLTAYAPAVGDELSLVVQAEFEKAR